MVKWEFNPFWNEEKNLKKILLVMMMVATETPTFTDSTRYIFRECRLESILRSREMDRAPEMIANSIRPNIVASTFARTRPRRRQGRKVSPLALLWSFWFCLRSSRCAGQGAAMKTTTCWWLDTGPSSSSSSSSSSSLSSSSSSAWSSVGRSSLYDRTERRRRRAQPVPINGSRLASAFYVRPGRNLLSAAVRAR